jgi:esterase/lipase
MGRSRWLRARMGWDPEVLDAMDSARAQTWWYSVPTLAVMADDDPRVAPKSLTWVRTQSQHTGTEITRYKSGGHVFMDGPHRDELLAATVNFLKRN